MIRDKLEHLYDWMLFNFYTKLRSIARVTVRAKKYCSHKSYFPELPRKSFLRIWFDQVIQCIRFGYQNDFYFPYGFDVKGNSEMNKYIHYTPFMEVRDANNSKLHSGTAILRDKLYFGFFCDALGINSGNNIGVVTLSSTFDLRSKKDIVTTQFLQSLNGDYIFKPIDGECGSGIFIINARNGVLQLQGEQIHAESLKVKMGDNRYLVQELVKQHPEMTKLHPQSLNTMRFVTIRDANTKEIVPFPSILRIGTGDSFVDNTSQGGLAVAVDLNDGHLGEYGYYKPEFGTKTAIHPDSNIRFADFTIPFFKEAKEQAIKLHSMLPTVQSIGWDIAIGENGPIFIEGNDNWEINGPQICNGPLKERFYKVLKYNKINSIS